MTRACTGSSYPTVPGRSGGPIPSTVDPTFARSSPRCLVLAVVLPAMLVSGCAAGGAAPATPDAGSSPASATTTATAPASSASVTPVTVPTDGAMPSETPTVTPVRTSTTTPTPTASFSPVPMAERTPDAPRTAPLLLNGVPIVSRAHPIDEFYAPTSPTGEHELTPETDAAITALIERAAKDGVTLTIRSGYRSFAVQDQGYKNAQELYSPEEVAAYYTPGGTSEHQTGLAADLTNGDGDRGDAFAASPAAAYVAAHANEFGLIVRYPQDKQAITGVHWEPWHVRYVGKDVAAHLAASPGLTLEEYVHDA